MHKFKSVSGKRVLSYNKVHLKFEDKIYRIFGKNLDTSDEHGTTGNGVGKSLMWSALLANPLYFTTPTSLFKGRGAKDLLSKKSAVKIAVDDYVIEQTSKGFTIFHNGVDQEVRTVPLAKTRIRKIFPLEEEIFYTTTYISAQRPYLIQRSKDDARIEVFSKLFHLNDYAKLRDAFAQKLRTVKDDEIKAGIHTQNMQSASKRLKELPKIDKTELMANKAELEAINRTCKIYEEDINTCEVDLRHLHSVQSIDAKLEELRPSYIHKGKPHEALKRLKAEREAERAYAEYKTALTEYKEAKKELEAELDELPEANATQLEADLNQLEDDLEAAKKQLAKVERQLEEQQVQENKNKEVMNALKNAGFDLVKDVPKEDVSEQLALYNSVLSLEELLHEHKDGNCPTCNSEIDVKSIRKQVERAKTEIPKLQKIYKAQKIKDQYAKIKDKVDPADYDNYNSAISQTKTAIKKVRFQLDKSKERARVEQAIKKLRAPTKTEKPSWSYKAKTEIEIVQQIVDAINSKRALLEKSELPESSTVADVAAAVADLEYKLKKVKKSLLLKQTKQAELSDRIDAATQAQQEHKLVKDEYVKAKTFLTELAENLSRRKIYEALVKAYSPKGLKIFMLQDILKLIEKNFNHYASLTFGENFKFANTVTPKGISMQVVRPNGDTSDVRELSGAESDCFILLCLISILPLLPDTYRTNLAVLDEPLSHSDEATRIRVIKNYVPALHAVVPNIVFISNTPEDVEGSVNLLVTKEKGKSTLTIL